jgi:hypothetical protein
MNTATSAAHQQRGNVLSLITVSMTVLLCLQLWLFIEVVHGALGGEKGLFLPAALVSAFCAAGNWQLWRLLRRPVYSAVGDAKA